MNLAETLYELSDEPIIPEENSIIIKNILNITKTYEFAEMNLSEEKLDELVENIKQEENFTSVLSNIISGLESVKSIQIAEDNDEEEYL